MTRKSKRELERAIDDLAPEPAAYVLTVQIGGELDARTDPDLVIETW